MRFVIATGLIIGGCSAAVDVDGPLPPTPGPVPLTCDVAAPIAESPTHRLTTTQYGNALRVALDRLGIPNSFELVAEVMSSSFSLPADVAPPDPRNSFKRTYRRLDRNVGDVQIAAWYDTALTVAEVIVADHRDALLGDCADVPSCLRSFFARLASTTQRRPATDANIDRLEAVYGDVAVVDDAALRDVVGVALAGAEFVYLLASGKDEPVATDVYALTGPELASRLSFTLWDSPPDDQLTELAASDALSDEGVFADQVDRLLDDPRAEAVVLQFFEDWLRLDSVPDFTSQLVQPGYVLFAGDQVPTAGLRGAAQQELRDMVMTVAWREQQPLSSLLTTPLLFPRTAELASLYGLDAAWDGSSSPPADTARPGILSRVGLVASGLVSNRPIIKGVFVLDQLLCIELGPPPPGAVSEVVDVPMPHTTRDYLTALTESPNSSCIGCHAAINPFGFASDMFDGLGRFRTLERIIDPTSAQDFGSLPINTTSDLLVTGQPAQVSNLDDVAREVLASGAFESCVVRHLFRHYASRLEQDDADGCWLESMRTVAVGGSIRDAIRAFVLNPTFRQRRVVESP